MPNHVQNILRAEGIAKFPIYENDEDGEKCIDFNKIIPMPEELKNTIAGGAIKDCVALYILHTYAKTILFTKYKMFVPYFAKVSHTKEHLISELEKRTENAMMFDSEFLDSKRKRHDPKEIGKHYLGIYEKYGTLDWYDWSCRNWGTKWNGYSCNIENENEIDFQTAWSNPEPVIRKLSEMFPDITFEHLWADEDMGNNTGRRVFANGEIIEGGYNDFCSNEAYETYVECWGETQCLYKDDDGNWQRRSCENCDGC